MKLKISVKHILSFCLILSLLLNLFPITVNSAEYEKELTDNESSYIYVNLFDYSTGNTETISPSKNYNSGINKNHNFKFLSDGGGLSNNHINKWTGVHGFPRTKIVESTLVNGYPKLVNGESLSYLFDSSSQSGKTSYINVGGLFRTNEKGYTYFNSDNCYAEFNTKSNSFVLKDVIKKNGEDFPVFYPFDSFDTSNNKAQKNIGVGNFSSGKGFTPDNANHYFGLTVETYFYKLADGKVNGEDMIFNFSGDDDVWVFIDDKLVLDIGGIHDTVSGSINFNTGDVYVWNASNVQQKQGNIYSDYGIDAKDFEKHKLNFFYLERGNSASNCNISFNLPTIPKESVALTKTIVDENNVMMNKNFPIDFQFLIKKNDKPLANSEYTLYTESGTKTCLTDSLGYMHLKNGDTAIFAEFSVTDSFEIIETDYALNGYRVVINEYEIVTMNKANEVTGIIPSASSGKLYVKDTQNVLFKNIIEELTDLSITKNIHENNLNIINNEFNIKLELNGEPYVGKYLMNGNIQETDDGEFVIKNTDIVTIENLPYGTMFRVSENKTQNYLQDYTTSSNVYDTSKREEGEETVVYGKIGGSSRVVSINEEIYNNENSQSITVKKVWKNDNERQRPSNITIDLYKNGELFLQNVVLSAENNWTYVFENLFVYNGDVKNVYTVKETKIGGELVVDDIAMGYYSETTTYENEIIITNTYGGNVIIKKTIDDKVNQNPVFIFKITDRFKNVSYQFVKFSGSETTKEIKINNLPLGGCTIEEIAVFRYTNVNHQSIEFNVKTGQTMVEFENKLVYVQYFSDVNHVKNHFVVGETMEKIE